jgi:hypothetical protein
MTALLVFLALQLCDFATTLLFLRRGVAEANPLVRWLIQASADPAMAVLLFKLAGCALAVFAWKSRRIRLLRGANIFFGACVAWNLVAIAAA